MSGQVTFIGIYDGLVSFLSSFLRCTHKLRHGGSAVSQYLRQELHGIFESANKNAIPELFAWAKELGGYFRRFKGGALAPWVISTENTPALDLEARATEAFFEARHSRAQLYTSTIPSLDRWTEICPQIRFPNLAAQQHQLCFFILSMPLLRLSFLLRDWCSR